MRLHDQLQFITSTVIYIMHILTTPFWTLKPSWYLTCGLLIRTSTTGAQETSFNLTIVCCLAACYHSTVLQLPPQAEDCIGLDWAGFNVSANTV